jgi:hypothetical protein
VSQPDYDLGQQFQPVAFLVRDQNPQMLGLGLGHGYRDAPTAERSTRSPITLVRSSIASIASAGKRGGASDER